MPVTYRIDRDELLVLVTITRAAFFYEWEGAMLSVLTDPNFRPGHRFLIDRRGAPAPSSDFIKRVVAFNDAHRGELGEGRRAVVVDNKADFDMGRMAEAFSEGSPSPIRVFTDFDEARRWLLGQSD